MIAVSGATGSIGSELVRLLAAEGRPFRALSRDPVRARDRFGPDVDIGECDLTRPETLPQALDGVDTLFVLTAVADDMSMLERNLVDAALGAGVERIVKLSAIGADQDSPLTLGREHGRSEALIRETGLPFTFLRPGSFMQNLFMHAGSIGQTGSFYAPYGDGRVGLIDTRDVAAVAAAVVRHPDAHEGGTLLLTGPEAVSHHQVAAAIGDAVGRAVTYVPVPPAAARGAMLEAGLPGWLVEDLLLLAEGVARGEAELVTDHVERLVGRPPHSIHDFARDHARAFGP